MRAHASLTLFVCWRPVVGLAWRCVGKPQLSTLDRDRTRATEHHCCRVKARHLQGVRVGTGEELLDAFVGFGLVLGCRAQPPERRQNRRRAWSRGHASIPRARIQLVPPSPAKMRPGLRTRPWRSLLGHGRGEAETWVASIAKGKLPTKSRWLGPSCALAFLVALPAAARFAASALATAPSSFAAAAPFRFACATISGSARGAMYPSTHRGQRNSLHLAAEDLWHASHTSTGTPQTPRGAGSWPPHVYCPR